MAWSKADFTDWVKRRAKQLDESKKWRDEHEREHGKYNGNRELADNFQPYDAKLADITRRRQDGLDSIDALLEEERLYLKSRLG